MNKGRAALALMVIIAVAAPLLAVAGSRVAVTDGNDAKSFLDIRKVERFGVLRPGYRVVTFRSWGLNRAFDTGFVLVNFDTFGSERFDYYAIVRSDGFRMSGSLYRDRTHKRDRRIGAVKTWRKDHHSVTIRLRLHEMRIGRKRVTYRWYVQTLVSGERCSNVCFDRAPNNGSIREWNGKPTQEPTPTITPTPTPTITPTPTLTVTPPPTPTVTPSP